MNNGKNDKSNKIILISGISVASITLLLTITSIFFASEAPDPAQLGPREKVSYMASKEFSRLPEAEKKKYMSKIGNSREMFKNLSHAERKEVFKNTRKIMQQKRREQIDKFFKMNKEEQNSLLDKMIAEREKHEAARSSQRGSKPPKPKGPGGDHKIRLQGILENTDSTTRGKEAEFSRRMEARRKQIQEK